MENINKLTGGNKRKRKNPETDRRQFNTDGTLKSGDSLIELARQFTGDTILLSFSRGKDSVATWLYLRDKFNVIPYYLYLIPGLSWEMDSLAYYEDYFKTKILRIPHPTFYDMLANYAYQTPERVPILTAMNLPSYDFATVDAIIARRFGLDDFLCAMGIRASDNLERRRLIHQMGVIGIGKKRRFFYPIWDWNVERVGSVIKRAGVKIPRDYILYGRTVVALNYRRLIVIREHFPDDYQKILQWFPLLDLEIFRYEKVA